jgi:O-antigen/teichoic acid export membrane protein
MFKKLISLFCTYAIGNIATQAIGLILIPVYTAYFTLSEFGTISLIGLLATLTTYLVSIPANSILQRFLFAPEFEKNRGRFLYSLIIMVILQSTVLSIAYIGLGPFLGRVLGISQDNKLFYNLYSIIILCLPIASLLKLYIMLKEKARLSIAIGTIGTLVSFLTIMLCLLVFKGGLISIAYGLIASQVFSIIACIPSITHDIVPKFSFALLKQPYRFSYPFLLSAYSQYIIEAGDRWLLRLFTSLETVGIYSFGYTISGAVNVVLSMPLKQSLLPLIYKSENEPGLQATLIRSASFYYFAFSIWTVLGISLFAKEVITVLAQKPEYAQSYFIIPIVSLAYVCNSMNHMTQFGLNMGKQSTTLIGVIIFGAILNTLLNLISIPVWGMMGAALSTLLSYSFTAITSAILSNRYIKIRYDFQRLLVILLLGIVLYLSSFSFLYVHHLFLILTLKLLLFAIFPLFLWHSGVLFVDEKNKIKLYFSGIYRNLISPHLN